ncbi:hypothetical protein BGW80DRAFT_1329344 [Lactifluus volemus]|nr:hypothetical protein BGW80DRAFT_1329344 [Lactifluus volemus]
MARSASGRCHSITRNDNLDQYFSWPAGCLIIVHENTRRSRESLWRSGNHWEG